MVVNPSGDSLDMDTFGSAYEKQRQKYAQRANDPEWILLVAELDKKIVGMIGATNNKSNPLLYKKNRLRQYMLTQIFKGKE